LRRAQCRHYFDEAGNIARGGHAGAIEDSVEWSGR
jgi:hypothetical protein